MVVAISRVVMWHREKVQILPSLITPSSVHDIPKARNYLDIASVANTSRQLCTLVFAQVYVLSSLDARILDVLICLRLSRSPY